VSKGIFQVGNLGKLFCSSLLKHLDDVFQFDMWNVAPTSLHDWAGLKARVAVHGVRNSLLLAPMPTASTAQILGNNEGVEAYTSNIYSRRVLSGEFQVKYLMFFIYLTLLYIPFKLVPCRL